MAEEKKTTTKKKTEEVKVEKRFCTNCGKELKDGETCNCTENNTASNAAVSINGDAILNSAKNTWNTILNVFKKPYTTVKEEVAKKDSTNTIILVVLLAITYALFLMANISSLANGLVDTFNSSTLGLTSVSASDLNIPYFKIFIYGILIYALMAFIPMLAAFIVSKITRNNFSLKKAFKLYVTSNAPMALIYLIVAVILLLNVTLLNVLGYIALAVMSIVCFFNFMIGYSKENTIREDRRSYALSSLVIIWVVVEVLALILVAGSVFGDIYNELSGNKTSSYTNSFKW